MIIEGYLEDGRAVIRGHSGIYISDKKEDRRPPRRSTKQSKIPAHCGKLVRFIVELPVPPSWRKREAENYVRSAVKLWSKSMSPEDPMWDASDYVTVRISKGL